MRQRWPAFARRWDEALRLGYVLLEGSLVEAACNIFSAQESVEPAAGVQGMTADQAIHLLHMHKHRVHGMGKAPGRMAWPPDPDEMRASILRKIEAIERKAALSAGPAHGLFPAPGDSGG